MVRHIKIPSLQRLHNKIEELDGDLPREMLKAFSEVLMSHEGSSGPAFFFVTPKSLLRIVPVFFCKS